MGLICVLGLVTVLGPRAASADGAGAEVHQPSIIQNNSARAVPPPRVPGQAPVVRPPRAATPAPDLPPTPAHIAPVVVTPPTASPAPAVPFFVPVRPMSLGEGAPGGDMAGDAVTGAGKPPRMRHPRQRDPGDDAAPRPRRERWEHRSAKKTPTPDATNTPPVAAGDRPVTPITPTPDTTTTPSPQSATASAKPGTAAKSADAAPIAPVVVPRPGAPSAAMLGVTPREMVVNQLVAIVPISRDGDLANDYGLSIDDETTIRSLGVRLVTFSVLRPRGLGDIIDLMGLDSRVQGAQPNFRYRTSFATTGAYPQSRMRIEPALGLASGAGVTVALIDTKVADLTSLAGHVAERVSVIENGGRGRHGTALAGLIADVAPAARLLSIEAFAEDSGDPDVGVSTTLSLARALDAAIERKADVINLSVAGPRDPLIGRLIRQALSRGIVVVAAAGNDGPQAAPRYPAAYDGVVAVTATDARDQPYSGGAQGAHVAVAAPGVDVRATVAEGVVGYVTGTSVSAAQVAGVAALLRERAPHLGSGEARRLLKETASPMAQGPGLVDAFAALSKASAFAGR